MKASIPALLCASCVVVAILIAPSSAQLRFPSLSSALSSLTGFGSSSSSGQQVGGSSGAQAPSASPYSGLVRDYGRNLMMAMSNIYPTLFKPPQQQQQQLQAGQSAQQSPFEQAFGAASQFGSQGLFSGQSPSFSFGGSTFSITPTLPFGSLTGGSSSGPAGPGGVAASQQQPQLANSPFSGSFGSSINSPSSFGPLSSSAFLQGPSFAPASSYNAAFEAANGGPMSSFGISGPPAHHSQVLGSSSHSGNSMGIPQASQSQPISSYSSLPSFASSHDVSGSSAGQLLGAHSQGVPSVSQFQPQVSHQPQHQQQQSHAPQHQHVSQGAPSGIHGQPVQQGAQFGQPQQHQGVHGGQPFAAPSSNQAYHYRPDVMSMAASMQVPSVSNSYLEQRGGLVGPARDSH